MRTGEALYFATDDGFVVCKLEWDEFDSRPDFYVWVAFGLPMKRGNLLRKYLPLFIEVAEYLECRAVRWLVCHESKGKPGRIERCGTEYRVLVDGQRQQTTESSAEPG